MPQDLTDLAAIRAEIAEMAGARRRWLARKALLRADGHASRSATPTSRRSRAATPLRRRATQTAIVARAVQLLDRTEAGRRPVRLLGVSVHNFCDSAGASTGGRLPFEDRTARSLMRRANLTDSRSESDLDAQRDARRHSRSGSSRSASTVRSRGTSFFTDVDDPDGQIHVGAARAGSGRRQNLEPGDRIRGRISRRRRRQSDARRRATVRSLANWHFAISQSIPTSTVLLDADRPADRSGRSAFRRSAALPRSPRPPPSRRPRGRRPCTDRRAPATAPVQMKNDVVALPGSSPRAIDTIPFTCFVSLNSGAGCRTSFCCFSVSGACARAQRAGLNDEARRDAMKRHAVVDAGLRQAQELPDVFGRLVGEELDRDRSRARVEHRAVARRAPRRSRSTKPARRRRVANRHAPDLDALGRQARRRRPASRRSSAATSMPSDTWPNTVYCPSSAG